MTVEQLLQKRYKVIALWPGCQHSIGEVFIHSLNSVWSEQGFCSTYDPFPHLFKKLAWYEDRDEKDMPEYVKSHNHYAQKVIKWEGRNSKDVPLFKFNNLHNEIVTGMANEWQPATEAEYLTFKNINPCKRQ